MGIAVGSYAIDATWLSHILLSIISPEKTTSVGCTCSSSRAITCRPPAIFQKHPQESHRGGDCWCAYRDPAPEGVISRGLLGAELVAISYRSIGTVARGPVKQGGVALGEAEVVEVGDLEEPDRAAGGRGQRRQLLHRRQSKGTKSGSHWPADGAVDRRPDRGPR